jgi:uncharacterized peroxidase-related enzyme
MEDRMPRDATHRPALIDIEPQTAETAAPAAAEILRATEKRMGFVPNMYRHMAADPAILTGYMAAYEAFRKTGGFTPAEQETVLLTISRINGCTYCVAAHSMIAEKKSGVPADSLKALREGSALPDAKLDALARFTEAMVESRGYPGGDAVDAFLAAGYTVPHILAIVVAMAAKTFSNTVNRLAGTEVDDAFAAYKVA